MPPEAEVFRFILMPKEITGPWKLLSIKTWLRHCWQLIIQADEFYILTDVPYVYLNYKKPDQQIAEFINHADARRYLQMGMFGEGSMAPKMEAALFFIEQGGSKSVITEATKLENKKYGSRITMD